MFGKKKRGAEIVSRKLDETEYYSNKIVPGPGKYNLKDKYERGIRFGKGSTLEEH